MENPIRYPYLPERRVIKYAPAADTFMRLARDAARKGSLDKVMPGGAVIVLQGAIIGVGANGSDFHEKNACQRIVRGCKTGEGYELCEGCHPKNHSEPKALADAAARGNDPRGADLYLWGHWWCCRWCWEAMIAAGIRDVYLLEGSERLFNKEHPDNVVGRQFQLP